MEFSVGKCRVVVKRGDITEEDSEAIVNAANSSLMGGGGVDGAIHAKGGEQIDRECAEIRRTLYPRGLPPGRAVITSGGRLKARYVIHAVGPVWRGGGAGEERVLRDAYRSSLELAFQKGIRSVSFPAISTGAYGYPMEDALGVALEAITSFLRERGAPEEVRLVLYRQADLELAEKVARERLGLSN
ncbi:O-acetyl-ADP-ribose deacetylase [Tardisphaera miroshnichenkoae]